MDHIVTDVNEGWNEEDPTQSLQCVFSSSPFVGCDLIGDFGRFKGSDDYLRVKVCSWVSFDKARLLNDRMCCFYSSRSTSQLHLHLSGIGISSRKEKQVEFL